MSLLIGFLTFILVLNCLFLMLLVLIQLPKKEAGAGIAFGGGAADALFGAGSGNALTKMTKYTAILFVSLSVFLSLLNSRFSPAAESNRRLQEELRQRAKAPAAAAPAAGNPAVSPITPIAPAGDAGAAIAPITPAPAPASIAAPQIEVTPQTQTPAPVTTPATPPAAASDATTPAATPSTPPVEPTP